MPRDSEDSDGSGALLSRIANPTQVNLLASYQGAAQAAHGIWANRQDQANQLSGQAQQDAIGSDGTYSPEKYRQNLQAAGPGAALAAQSGLSSNQALSTDQLEQAHKKLAYVNSASGALLEKGPDVTPADVMGIFQQGMSSGMLTLPEVQKQMATLPSDPAGLRAWAEQHRAQAHSAQQQLDQTYGTRQPVNSGNTTTFPVVPPASAGGTGPSVKMTTSPSERLSPVTGPVGPNGGPTTISAAEYARNRGLDPNTGDPLPNPAFANLPPALRGPNQAPPPAPAPQATGAGPAATNAMAASGTASSGAYTAISDTANKAVGQRALLQGMKADATQFVTGPGSSGLKDIKATIGRLGAAFGMAPDALIDPNKVAAAEDLDKAAAKLSDAMGAGSDARLSVNQSANPSSHNTPAGLHLIISKLIGDSDYAAFKGQAAAQYQKTQDPTGANSRQFEDQFRTQFDPRVFQFNRMDAAQQKQYLQELGAGKDKFKLDFMKTKQAGILPSD